MKPNTMRTSIAAAVSAISLGAASEAGAAGIPGVALDEVQVSAERIELPGRPVSGSQGTVLGPQLALRPILRTAELFEVVPGLIATQHSGDGKANQYFLRGINLDHGTDFASFVDGVPVNLATHGHGQGYTDLNFLIPELIERLDYRKGPYFADLGNFSAAGAVQARYRSRLDAPFLTLITGADDYRRALVAGSRALAGGELLLAGSHERSDGPWLLEENLRKSSGLLKFTRGTPDAGWNLGLTTYDGSWTATDQIPRRSVQSGALDRFGFVDGTSGGRSHRHSLSAGAWGKYESGEWRLLAYGLAYDLHLWSNFTYFTDPVNGDQFEQEDDRTAYGFDAGIRQYLDRIGSEAELVAGIQLRHDDIDPVGLYRTRARERFATVRRDAVRQTSYAAFASVDVAWTRWLRSHLGLRADHFDFAVDSSLPVNSGSSGDSIVSPKLSWILGPWADTELFLNLGRGFHSNDARGTTIRVDPADGVTPVAPVDALVEVTGYEVGLRTAALPGAQIALSLWSLELDSELLFIGDGGTTEASRPSRRTGLEFGVYWQPVDWIIVDADLAVSRPRFTDRDPGGDRIPGAVERAASFGLVLDHPRGWSVGARLRYLGSAALIEDDSVRSDATLLLNLQAGYRLTPRLRVQLSLLNAFDARAEDIAYVYESQLPGESAPVADLHFHPVEPRTLRVSATWKFGAD